MSCDVELCSFSNLSFTSPTSQLILQPFRRFTYVTAHSPTLPLLHQRHSSFPNPYFASPTSQALHLIYLASRPWTCHVLKQWSYRTYPSLVKLQLWFLSLRWKTCLWVELLPWVLSLHWKSCPSTEHTDDDDDNDTEWEAAPGPNRLVARLPPLGSEVRVSVSQCGFMVDQTETG